MPTVVLLEVDPLAESLAQRAPAAGLLPVAARPLLAWPAGAFRECGNVDRLVLVGPTVYETRPEALALVDETVLLDAPLSGLLEAALDRLADTDEVLLWPTNAPLIRPEMVEAFLRGAPTGAALTWALVRETRVRAAFPDSPDWPAHHFAADRLVWSWLASVNPAVLAGQRSLIRRLAERSVRLEMVKTLGAAFSVKLGTGAAPLSDLVRRVGEVLGAPCVAEILPYPELAFRVRSRSDYRVARERLETL